jgi:carbon storage regulator
LQCDEVPSYSSAGKSAELLDVQRRFSAHKEDQVMLVLSRQSDEAIIIGDHIRVTIVEVRGDKVRIGIDAPRDVTVHRQEIYDAIRRDSEREARSN